LGIVTIIDKELGRGRRRAAERDEHPRNKASAGERRADPAAAGQRAGRPAALHAEKAMRQTQDRQKPPALRLA
jgi:hypothetical protein